MNSVTPKAGDKHEPLLVT